MWELDYKESWALKNWCFWTVVLEKTLESPLDSNQSILKEISSECSLEGLMLKLKLPYFGHLMWRTDSLEKTLMLGKTESKRRWWQRMRWLYGITNSMDMSLSNLQELVDRQGSLAYCSSRGHKESDLTEQLNWTELMLTLWLGRIIVQLLRKVYIFTSISIYILFYGLKSHFTSEENETLGGKCLIECLTLEI